VDLDKKEVSEEERAGAEEFDLGGANLEQPEY
jgi:hypothetical protein